MGDSTFPLSAFAVSALLCWLLLVAVPRRASHPLLVVACWGVAVLIPSTRWIQPGKIETTSAIGIIAGLAVVAAAGRVIDRTDDVARRRTLRLRGAVAAAVLLAIAGVRLGLMLRLPPAFQALPTIAWVTVLTCAFGSVGGASWLPAALGVSAGVGLALANVQAVEVGVAVLSAAIGGACLGLIPHLRHGLVLGAGGSMAIGFALSAASILGVYIRGAPVPGVAVFAPVAILAVPLAEIGIAVLLRRDRDDLQDGLLSRRLEARGLDRDTASAILFFDATICSLAGASLPAGTPAQDAAALAAIGASLAILALLTGVLSRTRHP